jgi:cyclic-di-GMP-binding biofilm dispersal mediator protein
MDVSGHRILVTGGTGELGRRIAAGLRQAGAHTVIAGRPGERLNSALSHSEAFGVDLSFAGAGAALIQAVRAAGTIDGIVLAHGVVAFGNVADTPIDAVSAVIAINQTSVIDIVTAAIPSLRESKDAGNQPFIATVSGVISENAVAGMAAYGASKAGLRHFVAAAQRELRREGIRVFDTRPAHTETGLATRAVVGQAPNFPAGASPDAVAERIVSAIINDETDVASTQF